MPNDLSPTRGGPRSNYEAKCYGPPAKLHDDTRPNQPDAFADAEPRTRSADARPSSWNAETLTFEAVVATRHPVQRRDAKGPFLEVLDAATLNPAADLPVYDSHRGGSSRETIGVVQSVRIEGGNVVAVLRLSAADDLLWARQRVADGTIRHTSIGYRVAGWTETRDAEGARVKSPTAWTLTEVSLVPNPADPNARIRSQTAPGALARPGGISDNRAANEVTMTDETITPEAEERTRRADLRHLARSAGIAAETADDWIDSGLSLDDAKGHAFDHVQSRSRTAPVIRTTGTANDDPQVILRRQSDAIATRMSGCDCPEDARQYVGDSFLDVARDTLARTGVSTRGMNADAILTRAAHGTSDFPLVVSNAMGKTAAQAYEAAETLLKRLCRQRVLRDFKPSTSIRLGQMGRLQEIAESGEITHTSRAENGETMHLKTYARGLNVSRNLLVNDDLGLLGDMTAAFGDAAAQTEAEILVELVTGNPDLSDGTAVFDASRGNLAGTGVSLGSAGDMAALDAARKHMRTVKGLDGKTIVSAAPRYLLVGPESETEAEKLLAAIYAGTVGDVNAWANKLTLIVEPRIEDDRWYLFADPARLPCLQYGYLAGAQGVQIQRAEAWDTLGLKFRAYLDFGAGWLDHRGAYLNEGEAA